MPFHLPGHNYLGPGTKDFTAKPTDAADQVAREHDLAYLNAHSDDDIRKADREAIPKFLGTASVPGLIGAAGIGIKYGVESVTGVLYGNNSKENSSMTGGTGYKRAYEDSSDSGPEAKRLESVSSFNPPDSVGLVNSSGSGGMSGGGSAPGTSGGVVVGAGHNPGGSLKFTKKFQIYTGAFQFTNMSMNDHFLKAQYAESGNTTVYSLATPLCCLDPNQLPLFLTEQEFDNLPPYAFARSCKIRVVPLGFRLPFETNSSHAGTANSQLIVQCAKAVGLNHKFEGYTCGYSADPGDLTKPTGYVQNVSLRSLLYGQSENSANIGCNVGIVRHFNWYYNIFNLGRYGHDGEVFGGTPNLLKSMEVMNVNDVRGLPIIDYQYNYKCAPLKMGRTSQVETYYYQSSGSRKTTFKAWRPHNSEQNNIDVANVLIDGMPTNGGYQNNWEPLYTTIVEKAAFMILDPKEGRQSDVTPPLVHFGCMPIQSNPPLAPHASFSPGVIQWEVHTEMDVEFLTDSPYPHNSGPWQIQYDPVVMRGIVQDLGWAGINSSSWKAFNRGRHVFDKTQLPWTSSAIENVITSKIPILFPSDDVNDGISITRRSADADEVTDEAILSSNRLANLPQPEKGEFIRDYRRSLRLAEKNKKQRTETQGKPEEAVPATSKVPKSRTVTPTTTPPATARR